MNEPIKVRDGRVWMQFKKFQPYDLKLLGGLTDVIVPAGAITPIRRPSEAVYGEEVIYDFTRGSKEIATFTIGSRLQKLKNYLLGINCAVNVHAHLGKCDRPDRFSSAHTIIGWNQAHKGATTIATVTQMEGDDAPITMSVPFSAIGGPYFMDMLKYFVSARTVTQTADVLDMVALGYECVENCQQQVDAGDYGYATTDAYAGSPTDYAEILYTTDAWETSYAVTGYPFGAGENPGHILIAGIVDNHRIWVFRSTTDAANPAELAYADVTTWSGSPLAPTVSWNNVNIGSVNGQYITAAFYLNDANMYVGTNDGYIYKSADGGLTWTLKSSAAGVQINGISALSDDTVWVVGASNLVYLSEDGGQTYTAITGPTAGDALRVVVTPDRTVYIGDSLGAIYGSFNKGTTWTTMSLQGATVTSVPRIKNAPGNNDVLYAIGTLADGSSRCWMTTDGGAAWLLWSLNMPANSGINALVVLDENTVFVGGNAHPVEGNAFITHTLSNWYGV